MSGIVIFDEPIIMKGFLRDLINKLTDDEFEYFLQQGYMAIERNGGDDIIKGFAGKRRLYSEKWLITSSILRHGHYAYRVNYKGFDILVFDKNAKEASILLSEDLFEL